MRGQAIIADVIVAVLALSIIFTLLSMKQPTNLLSENMKEVRGLQALVYSDSIFVALTENNILQNLLGNPLLNQSLFYYDTTTNRVRVYGPFIPEFNRTITFYLSRWTPKGAYTCLLIYDPEDLQRLAIDPICAGDPPKTTVYCTTGWCTHLRNPDRLAYMVEYNLIPISSDIYTEMLSTDSVIYLSTGTMPYSDLLKVVSTYMNTTGHRLMFLSMYNTLLVKDLIRQRYIIKEIDLPYPVHVSYNLYDIQYRCVFTKLIDIQDAVPLYSPLPIDPTLTNNTKVYPFYFLPREKIIVMNLDEDHCVAIGNYSQSYLLSDLIYTFYENIVSRKIQRYVAFTVYGKDEYEITLPDGTKKRVVHYYAFPKVTKVEIYSSII